MAVPRPVWCPKCGTERETKANQGVTLACTACGARYRIPADPQPPANAANHGVTIEHGTAVIPQAARPRPRTTTAPPEPAPEIPEPAPVTNPEGVTGDVQYLKETGRRGGLANYVRTRRHG